MGTTYSSAQMAITFCLRRCSNWFSRASIVCQASGKQKNGRDKVGDNPVDENADALRGWNLCHQARFAVVENLTALSSQV
jgi:hypothetical protein